MVIFYPNITLNGKNSKKFWCRKGKRKKYSWHLHPPSKCINAKSAGGCMYYHKYVIALLGIRGNCIDYWHFNDICVANDKGNLKMLKKRIKPKQKQTQSNNLELNIYNTWKLLNLPWAFVHSFNCIKLDRSSKEQKNYKDFGVLRWEVVWKHCFLPYSIWFVSISDLIVGLIIINF